MAVKTKLSKSDINTIILNYDIGDLIDFKGIIDGVENTNYLIITTEGKFILTLFEERVKISDLPFYENLLIHLYQNHVNIPYFIPNKLDNSFFSAKAKRGVIIPFFEGKAKKDNFLDSDLSKLGKYLAKFHLASKDFHITRNNYYDYDNCRKLYMDMYMRNFINQDSDQLLREAFDAISLDDNLPKGVIHADLFPDNVFFLNNEIEAIIDPYFACNDFFIYDLAICASAWCFDQNNNLNNQKILHLLKGYNSVRKLENIEIKLFREFCILAALRFYLTRLQDSKKNIQDEVINEKDPEEYKQKIRIFLNWSGFKEK